MQAVTTLDLSFMIKLRKEAAHNPPKSEHGETSGTIRYGGEVTHAYCDYLA